MIVLVTEGLPLDRMWLVYKYIYEIALNKKLVVTLLLFYIYK